MKSLYDEDARYTDDAASIDSATRDALTPILDEWTAKGYSPREIAHLMSAAVQDIELDAVMGGPPFKVGGP